MFSVNFIKLAQPVKTRWNSIAKMATTILDMKDVLEHVKQTKENEAPILCSLVPTEQTFTILRGMQPLLVLVKEYSNKFESEFPNIATFMVDIYNMKEQVQRLIQIADNEGASFEDLDENHRYAIIQLMRTFQERLQARLERYGSDEVYAIGAVLNPVYKGVPLFKLGLYDKIVDRMVEDHPTTAEFLAQEVQTSSHITNKLSEAEIANLPAADRDIYERKQALAARMMTSSLIDTVPPLRKELEKYQDMFSAEKNDDYLQWWKANAKHLPLLAAMARDYYALQITSSASERVFSLGGRIVTNLRSGLSPLRTSKQVFICMNEPKVHYNMTQWNLHAQVKKYT